MKRFLIFLLFFVGIITIMSVVTYAVLTFKIYNITVVDEKGNPIPNVRMDFEYKKNLDISGKHGKWYKEQWMADDKGQYTWIGFAKYNPNIQYTNVDGYEVLRNKKLKFGENKITLRKILKTGNLIWETKFVFPEAVGKYPYDMLAKDFLPPYGKGKTADINFIISENIEKQDPYPKKYVWDIEFIGEKDGMQFFMEDNEDMRGSTFIGLYEAPSDGYEFKSKNDCENAILKNIYPCLSSSNMKHVLLNFSDEKHFLSYVKFNSVKENYLVYYNAMYYFRIRSESGKVLYGKIMPVSSSGFYVEDEKIKLNYNYILNIDGGREMRGDSTVMGTIMY